MNPATWKAVDSPASATLHDVVGTAHGPCAVGGRGLVLGRSSDGTWGVVVENGPGARGRTLYCADATDDGERVWFGGASGALGCYDLRERRRTDFSKPAGLGNALRGLAVTGERGSEKLLASDGSGHTLPGEMTSGALDWEDPRRPAGDTALTAVCSDRDGVGYGTDSNGNVWRTTAEGWDRIGVAGAQNSFYAASVAADALVVGGGNGRVHERRPPGGSRGRGSRPWTPYTLGSFTVEALAQRGERLLAGGTSGSIYVRRVGREWTGVGWPGSKTILGVAVGDPGVAVGKNGTIVEPVSGGD